MRLNLYLRGVDLLDVELHAGRVNVAVFQPRPDDAPNGPKLEATSGGQFEQAEPMQPDTPVFGYGTRPESRA
jgi:hypothetical protein